LQPSSLHPSFPLNLTVRVTIERLHATVSNILAYLPGKTDEYVILGAHYDHLGRGQSHSLPPSQVGQIHPVADDNASATAGLLDLVSSVALRLDNAADRPTFVAVIESPNPHAGTPSGGGGGYGPYFGSIPDFGQTENGVRFSDVKPGSPAAKAGFQARDVLIQ